METLHQVWEALTTSSTWIDGCSLAGVCIAIIWIYTVLRHGGPYSSGGDIIFCIVIAALGAYCGYWAWKQFPQLNIVKIIVCVIAASLTWFVVVKFLEVGKSRTLKSGR